MADVENVIKAWNCCNPFNRKCKECPYEKDCYHDGISRHMVADALSVIEELQAEIKRLTKPADGTWIQKADATGHEYSMCSACDTVINTPDGCGGYYKLDMTGAKYCPNCGAKMD